MSALGFVVGESRPTSVTAVTSRALSVGEYVTVRSGEGDILGLVERSSVASAAFADVRNFEEAEESRGIAGINSRDKTFTAHVSVLGFTRDLGRGVSTIPAVPAVPGTEIARPGGSDLEAVFAPGGRGWVRMGHLLRDPDVEARINLDRIVSRHLGILAMTGMGKSNLVSLVTKHIAGLGGTVIVFDYHNDYTSLRIPRVNVVDAKINPRLLDADQLSEVVEIRDGANVQQRVMRMALTSEVKKAKSFWDALKAEIGGIIDAEAARIKEIRPSAYRVQDIVEDAQKRFEEILDPEMGDPMGFIREGRANVLNISGLSEKQANVAVAFYMQQLLKDRKNASIAGRGIAGRGAGGGGGGGGRGYRFRSPIFAVIEEAHVFIPKDRDTGAKYWAAKIAREGRKFGLGLGVVSQRPRSVDLNVLSQIGSFAIMKIIQEDDQRQIAAATESTSRELISQLASLNVGDAVLVGQWTNLPSLVHVDEVREKVMGSDQSAIAAWERMGDMDAITESTQGLVNKDLLLQD